MDDPVYDNILVDTCVFSYMFRNDTRGQRFAEYLKNKHCAVSFMTVAELYRGAYKNRWSNDRVARLETELGSYSLINSNKKLSKRWAYVTYYCGARGKTIAHADAWQAACALTYGLPFITNNMKHFIDVPGLTLIRLK